MSPVVEMDWDMDGETLAVLQRGESAVTVWNVTTKNYTVLDVSNNTGDLATFIRWSKTHAVLAIGSEKGALTFYNKQTQRKIPTVGKHSRTVNTGDWNEQGYLITGAEDRILTVSTHNGDTHLQPVRVSAEPFLLKWPKARADEESDMVTMVLSSKILCI
jgi:WD repeat-containing protein 19